MIWDTFNLPQGNYFNFSPDWVAGLYMKEFNKSQAFLQEMEFIDCSPGRI